MVFGPAGTSNPIKFGDDFELDPRTGELRRAGRALKLERIPAQVLLLLVEERDSLVTRDQIVERIWGKDVHLDTDNSINGAIRKIRQVLKDDSERPRFVQTITGQGYRFIAPVSEAYGADSELNGGPPALEVPTHSPDAVPTEPRTRVRWLFPVAIAAVLTVALGAYFLRFRNQVRPAPSTGRSMIAVLPFENLTGDAGQDYFSDGMTEEMISQLGNADPQHLGVIARTSVMRYKHSQEPLQQISRALGVQYVLEGSVRREADKVRITAQLIQMKDQSHLWAREYDRELSSVLALQAEIAQQVANEIQVTLDGSRKLPSNAAIPPALSPNDLAAYDLYLKGQYFWNKRTAEGFTEAINYFQQAIAKNPGDARAYAGMADAYALIPGYGDLPPKEFGPRARAAASRALELDDQLPEAHTARAFIAEDYDWDWATAEKEFRRAIQLNPNYATAHHWYAECLALQGRFDEAFPEIERARQLDPLSLIIGSDEAMIFYYARQYDRALDQFRGVLEMEPMFPRAQAVVTVYIQKGMFSQAISHVEKSDLQSAGPWSWAMLAEAAGRSGDKAKGRLALRKLEELNRRHPLDSLSFAVAYIGMDEKEQAMKYLEKAYREHSSGLTALKVDAAYDPLRSDPRFQDLLRRIGLAP